MRTAKWLIYTLAMLAVGVAWAAVVAVGALNGWLRTPIAARDDPAAFMRAVAAQVAQSTAGDCVVLLLRGGRPAKLFSHSVSVPVDADSIFQAASISKWLTAWGVLRLVEAGRVDLDAPVDRYLRRWHLPPSNFDNRQVTVRRLLSHTAGLGDRLGFLGFPPGATPPSIVEELQRPRDGMPGTAAISLVREPGSRWQYSGGGYLLLQLLIEDVSHERFSDYMRSEVLLPLGLRSSSFDASAIPTRSLAPVFDEQRRPATRYRFTAVAAASVYTSASDLARFALAHAPGPRGEAPGRSVLRPATVRLMATPAVTLYGLGSWGLGVRTHVRSASGHYVFGHDGNNFPALHHAVRIDADTGDGIVVLGSGDNELAARLAEAWVFWHTGRGDLDTLRLNLPTVGFILLIGWVGSICIVIALARRRHRRA